MSEKVYVFAARFPPCAGRDRVYPAQRAEEIASCGSESVRAGKYHVWKLLGYALKQAFGQEIEEFSFTRDRSGKWRAEGVEFSLSHSRGVAAVALSRIPVGVDVELLDGARFSRPFAQKTLTRRELDAFGGGDAAERCNLLWTVKEAIFKCTGGAVFRPEQTESDALPARTVRLRAGEEQFFLTVAAADLGDLSFFFPRGDLKTVSRI